MYISNSFLCSEEYENTKIRVILSSLILLRMQGFTEVI